MVVFLLSLQSCKPNSVSPRGEGNHLSVFNIAVEIKRTTFYLIPIFG
jgi:hypothetical protein